MSANRQNLPVSVDSIKKEKGDTEGQIDETDECDSENVARDAAAGSPLRPEIKEEELNSEDVAMAHIIKSSKIVDGRRMKCWKCGICAKEFGHHYTLRRHLPTHTDERKYPCTVCGKAFRQLATLSQHRAIHSDECPYACELCEKSFNRLSNLIQHRKTHTGQKPHQCHLCHKAFHQKGNLRNHIFTHTNERPYKCDVCNKGFNQMSNLMCHKLTLES